MTDSKTMEKMLESLVSGGPMAIMLGFVLWRLMDRFQGSIDRNTEAIVRLTEKLGEHLAGSR